MSAEAYKIKDKGLKLYKQEADNEMSFIYYGHFSDRVNDSLVPLAEIFIGKSQVDLKIRKRAFYIFVECIQNVNRHSSKGKRSKSFPHEIFSIRQKQNRFNIAFGNVMPNSKVGFLKSKIDDLNKTSVEKLNLKYKRILKDTVLSKLGGAGLGLIEVARKSGNKIRYKFDKLDDSYSYFSMETNINEPGQETTLPKFDGLSCLDLYKQEFSKHKFGFFLKAPRETFLELKERNLFVLMNKLDKPGFFKLKNPENYLSAIIESINGNCMEELLPGKGLILKLERVEKERYFNLCLNGNDVQVEDCVDDLRKNIDKQETGNSIAKKTYKQFFELLNLLQYNTKQKTLIETGHHYPGNKFLIIRTPL